MNPNPMDQDLAASRATKWSTTRFVLKGRNKMIELSFRSYLLARVVSFHDRAR
jgi:hypothetical protein